MPITDAAVGTVIAAFIAAVVSLLGLIISKENKISEFRQAWIDALRSDISIFISFASVMDAAAEAGFNPQELFTQMKPSFLELNQAGIRIRLRLNPMERESLEVLTLIDDIERFLVSPEPDHSKLAKGAAERLVVATQVVLKQEWLVVRKGERVYRYAKVAAFILIIASAATLIGLTVKAVWQTPSHPPGGHESKTAPQENATRR